MATITIVGTGLIGGSMGLALRQAGHFIIGCDSNPQNLEKAKSIGAIDAICQSIEMAVSKSQVAILAIPVDRIIEILPSVLDNITENGVVIDTGSTKQEICHSINSHPNRSAFVAAHPMAGSEQSGPEAARLNLFAGKKVVVCDAELSSKKSLEVASSLFNQLGLQTIYTSPAEHDATVALVSHLPQVLAYAYAGMVGTQSSKIPNWNKMASTGFDTTTRLALSSADVWMPILCQNKDKVVESIEMMISTLSNISKNLRNDNYLDISNTIESARNTRSKFLTTQLSQTEKV